MINYRKILSEKKSEKLDRFYYAYGSNLNLDQMEARCPSAQIYKKFNVRGYRLVYRYSASGAYATLIKDETAETPMVVYKISEKHEFTLDNYEGYPVYYKKKEISVKGIKGIIYIMPDSAEIGKPKEEYLERIRKGYMQHKLNLDLFYSSIAYNLNEIQENYEDYMRTVKKKNREYITKTNKYYNSIFWKKG